MKASDPFDLLAKVHLRSRIILMGMIFLLCSVVIAGYCFLELHQLLLLMAGLVGIAGLSWIYRRSLEEMDDVLGEAHRQNIKLEYSGFLISSASVHQGLARIQEEKAKNAFVDFEYKIPWNGRSIKSYIFLIIGISILTLSIQFLLSVNRTSHELRSGLENKVDPMSGFRQDSAYISKFSTTIVPPGYTGQNKRNDSGSIEILERSEVIWDIEVVGPESKLIFYFGSGDTIALEKPFRYNRMFKKSDFFHYVLKTEGSAFKSDYFSIRVFPDAKPIVDISGVEEFTRLSWGIDHKIDFDINILDEFALTEAFISATIAKGSGEAVKFRERKYDLKDFRPGRKKYTGTYHFSTLDLGMEPGDELYFFVRARDNYPYQEHWTKSTTYFIQIQDTANYQLVETSGMQVDLMPDFFRSQRQIIIDSEQLLSDKNKISRDSFKTASNMLGYDQKMLRLKYGQFLGEESESGIAFSNEETDEHSDEENHDAFNSDTRNTSSTLESARELISEFNHDHDHEEEENQLLSTKGTEQRSDPSMPTWVEALSHNHDNTEMATFHNISIKSKLKAALSEMWDAELHLRLFDPTTSLPYQYKSLGLLQEVKNHARIYVHRIGFDPPAIKESENRLQGNQDKIVSPILSENRIREDDYLAVKVAIGLLGMPPSDEDRNVMEQTAKALARISLYQPYVLPVLSGVQIAIRNEELNDIYKRLSLRKELIKVLPYEAPGVKNTFQTNHHISQEVAKKMNF